MAVRLGFGLNPLPPGVETAWGARLIITQRGGVDQVHDRTDAIGPDKRRYALLDALRDQAGSKPFDELKRLLTSGELSTREDKRVTLFEDDTIIVEANPNSSAGYCYVVAYFKADLAPAATSGSAPRCACTERGMEPVSTDPEVDGRCRRCGDFIEYVSDGVPVMRLYRRNLLANAYTLTVDQIVLGFMRSQFNHYDLPLDHLLRRYLTAKEDEGGLTSSFEEGDYQAVYDAVFEARAKAARKT